MGSDVMGTDGTEMGRNLWGMGWVWGEQVVPVQLSTNLTPFTGTTLGNEIPPDFLFSLDYPGFVSEAARCRSLSVM